MSLDPETWERVQAVFHAASELPPADRATYLDTHCDDETVRREVESLLASHDSAGAFIEDAISEEARASVDRVDAHTARQRFGPYEIERMIGRGGMGTVYLARRADRQYERRVALKVIRGALVDPVRVARFRSERQILASLTHPNIAQLLDGGETEDGLPYLVMEHVEGRPILEYCDEERLDVRARLDLFRVVCAALHHAHTRLVVHRDLKPENILVTSEGIPKLLDFGIAKLLDDDAAGAQTLTIERVLTPDYASPEQIRGEPITTASDVYSLGVILYELLSGVRPYTFGTTSPLAIARTIESAEVTRPSDAPDRSPPERSDAISRERDTTRDALRRTLRGDLDTIVAHAMRREPERRYATVEQLSDDIRRHLRGQTVSARPDTLGYRVATLVRRNRPLVAATLAVLLALITGLIVSTVQFRRAQQARARAEHVAYTASLSAAEAALRADQPAEARRQLERAPESLRGWEWRHLQGRLDRSRLAYEAHERGVTALAFTPDGTGIWSSSLDEHVALHDAATGARLASIGPLGAGVETLAAAPDGRTAYAGTGDGRVLRCTSDGDVDTLMSGPGWAHVALSSDGRRLAAGFLDGPLHLLSVPSGEEIGRTSTTLGFAVPAFTSNGRLLAVGTGGGEVRILDARSLAPLRTLEGHARRVMRVTASAEGDRVATSSMDRTVRVWGAREGTAGTVFRGHDATVAGVVLDGDTGFSAGGDRRLLVWDLESGVVRTRLTGHHADVFSLAISPDRRTIAAGGWDGRVLLFDRNAADIPTYRIRTTRVRGFAVRDVAVHPEGAWVACVSEVGEIELFDARTMEERPPLPIPDVVAAVVDPGGRLVLAVAGGGVRLVDAETAVIEREWRGFDVRAMAMDASSGRLAFACADDSLRLASLAGGRTHAVACDTAGAVVFSPRGDLVATGHADGRIRILEVPSGTTRRTIPAHDEAVTALAFSPSGAELASVSLDGSARVWAIATGERRATLVDGAPSILTVTYLAGGTRIALGGNDQIVRLYDAASGGEVLRLNGHVGRILDMAYDAAGDALVTASFDGTVRRWDTANGPR